MHGVAFDSIHYTVATGELTYHQGTLHAVYNGIGQLTEYHYNYSDDTTVSFDGRGGITNVRSGSGLTADDLDLSRLPELVGDPDGFVVEGSMAPDAKVYASLADAGIDLQAMIDRVPAPQYPQVIDNALVLPEGERRYQTISVYFGSGGSAWWAADAVRWDFAGLTEPESGYLLGQAVEGWDAPGMRIVVFYTDEEGVCSETSWDMDTMTIAYSQFTFPASMDVAFNLLRPGATSTGMSRAECDAYLAYYRADGSLAYYEYTALDGERITYSADRAYDTSDERHPPLEIIGEVKLPESSLTLTTHPQGPPDAKIYATLELAGIDAPSFLALIPDSLGLTVEGSVVTLPDNGYTGASVFVLENENRYDALLADGVWTIDCQGFEPNDDVARLEIYGADAQGRSIVQTWQLNGRPVVLVAYGAFSNGDGMLCVSLYSGTSYWLDVPRVSVFYDENGRLTEYRYSAGNQTVRFRSDNTCLELPPDADPADYPPLEIICE